MANRQVKFMGYTDTETNASFVFNGVTVFDGSISASGSKDTPVELFSFDVDQTLSGNIPMSITVTNGNISFTNLTFNYTTTKDPTTFTNNELNDKLDITLDNEPYLINRVGNGDDGAWHVNVSNNQTLNCNYVTSATFVPSP
jgi:hypothetical protein